MWKERERERDKLDFGGEGEGRGYEPIYRIKLRYGVRIEMKTWSLDSKLVTGLKTDHHTQNGL